LISFIFVSHPEAYRLPALHEYSVGKLNGFCEFSGLGIVVVENSVLRGCDTHL
jgi:hypothetical protein